MNQNQDNIFLLEENGTPQNSLQNLYIFEREHGPIVGTIHRLEVKTMSESSAFFFDDGHIHNTLGLSLYDKSKDAIKIVALKAALCRIPLLSQALEGITVLEFIEREDVQEFIENDNLTIVFIFRPVSGSGLEIRPLIDSKGYTALDNAMQKLLDAENNEVIEPIS